VLEESQRERDLGYGRGVRGGVVALVLCSLVAGLAPSAVRADRPPCPETAPPDAEVIARLAWLERRIDGHEDDMRRWLTAFVIVNTVLTGLSLTLAFTEDEDEARIDQFVDAGASAISVISLLTPPPPVIGAGDAIRALPRTTPEERLAAMRAAEHRLEESASMSSFTRGWLSGLGAALFVGAVGISYLARDRPEEAYTFAIAGVALGTAQSLTHPTGGMTAWRVYEGRHHDAACIDPLLATTQPDLGPRVAIAPAAVGPSAAGLSLALSF
jgi:hypothetical protein